MTGPRIFVKWRGGRAPTGKDVKAAGRAILAPALKACILAAARPRSKAKTGDDLSLPARRSPGNRDRAPGFAPLLQ